MNPSQLGRIAFGPPSLSADEQVATVDKDGSYGDLMDTIDQVLAESRAKRSGPSRRRPRTRKARSASSSASN